MTELGRRLGKGHWTLSQELAELERTDPAVSAAAQALDDMAWRAGIGVPVSRFPRCPQCGDRGCRVEASCVPTLPDTTPPTPAPQSPPGGQGP